MYNNLGTKYTEINRTNSKPDAFADYTELFKQLTAL